MLASYTGEESTFEDGVRCYVCPDCAFTFDAVRTDNDADGRYTCPACEITDLRERLAFRLLAEAEVARTSANGKHPDISVMTHAAALRYAADLVREED